MASPPGCLKPVKSIVLCGFAASFTTTSPFSATPPPPSALVYVTVQALPSMTRTTLSFLCLVVHLPWSFARSPVGLAPVVGGAAATRASPRAAVSSEVLIGVGPERVELRRGRGHETYHRFNRKAGAFHAPYGRRVSVASQAFNSAWSERTVSG